MYGYIESEVNSIIMRIYRGSLAGLLGDKSVLVLPFSDIARQIANGLFEMHKYGITHCDIKKNNILYDVTADCRIQVFITDFGVSQVKLANEKVHKRTNVKLQALSIAYGAPEVLEQILVDNRVSSEPRIAVEVDLSMSRTKESNVAMNESDHSRDLYALGILMWELSHR